MFKVSVDGSRKFYLFATDTQDQAKEWVRALKSQLAEYR
jgi:hypothetical protein